MFTVYILKSLHYDRYYVGHTNNINDRRKRHNAGRVKSTKNFRPWLLIRTEEYKSRSGAYRREVEIKNYKSGIKFKRLVGIWKE